MSASKNARPVLWVDLDLERFASFVTDSGWFVRRRRDNTFCYSHEPTGPVSTIALKEKNGKVSWLGQASRDYDSMLGNTSNRDKRTKIRVAARADYVSDQELDRISFRNSPECWYCGRPFVDGGSPRTREHLIPVSKAGGDRFENIVSAHMSCNRFVGSADISIKKLMRVLLREHSLGRSVPDLTEFATWLETFMAARKHDTIKERAPVVQSVRAPISKIGGAGSKPAGGAINMKEG